jgi:hypothetical protein
VSVNREIGLELSTSEANLYLFEMRAIKAHACADWEAERRSLESLGLLDLALPAHSDEPA